MNTTAVKTKRGFFVPWCHEAEMDEYNDESRRGWHLSKRTLRDMTYEYNPSVQYRYAIDYRTAHDEERYLELFQEDGWERIGSVNDAFDAKDPHYDGFRSRSSGCWYVFRKEYDPGRPEVEYQIVTDEVSVRTFKNTLTKKYLYTLALELLIMFLWLPDGRVFTGLQRILFLSTLGLDALTSLFRLLCVTTFRPRRPLRGLFAHARWHTTFLSVIVLALCVLSILSSTRTEDRETVPITAANTPVQLFLDLRPDITVDEVMLLAEEYDLEATASYHQRSVNTGKYTLNSHYNYTHDTVYTIYLVPDPGEDYTQTSSLLFYRGVAMALSYDPDTMELESAYLSIDTDDGRAYCHYFPGEPTMEDCETGFNLFLRKSALSRQKYYHADTPEEIIDIAYPVLYPNGLE